MMVFGIGVTDGTLVSLCWSAGDAALTGLEEGDEVEDVGVGSVWGGGDGRDGIGGGGAAHEEGLVGFSEGAGTFFG